MRLRYDANRGKEVYHLTMCQPTARKAVRLQALLPNKDERRTIPDKLDKLQVVFGIFCPKESPYKVRAHTNTRRRAHRHREHTRNWKYRLSKRLHNCDSAVLCISAVVIVSVKFGRAVTGKPLKWCLLTRNNFHLRRKRNEKSSVVFLRELVSKSYSKTKRDCWQAENRRSEVFPACLGYSGKCTSECSLSSLPKMKSSSFIYLFFKFSSHFLLHFIFIFYLIWFFFFFFFFSSSLF